jgi:hypothetical protein
MTEQDKLITFVGDVRQKLFKNEFYTQDKLDDLLNIISGEEGYMGGYISSHAVDYDNKVIQIQFRKNYMKKFDDDKYNSMAFYNAIDLAMDKFFSNYKTSIYSLLEIKDVLKFFNLPKNLFYHIGRIGENTVIINL